MARTTRSEGAPPRILPDVAGLRTDQRERRQRIVDAAQQLMFDVDYERIQVKDVADRAGVALGTLYRYFHSKDHLFACALQSWSDGFGIPDQRASGPTVDRVKAVYRRAARAFEKQPRVSDVLIQVQSSKDRYAGDVYRDFARRQTEAFAAALAGSRLPEAKRRDVVAVMSAVLDQSLRSWQLGLVAVDDVAVAIDRAADLICT